LKFTSITQRFIFWFVVIALLPIILLSYSLLRTFGRELQQTVAKQISVIADRKVEQIDTYLNERSHDAFILSQGNTARLALRELTRVLARSGAGSVAYRRQVASYRDFFYRFVSASGFQNLYLISAQGKVVYSLAHEADFASDLFSGPYRNSGLAKVTRTALSTFESSFSAFDFYAPSGDAIAAFIAVPMMDRGKLAGVLALRIDSARVFQVLQDNTGLGYSGETVVARLLDAHSAVLMAPLKSDPDAALKHKIQLDGRQQSPYMYALNGERGSGAELDYNGVPVVAAWRYLPRMGWGMVVKMDAAEALAPLYQMRSFGLLVLGLTLVGALIAAVMLGRRVVIPLRNIIDSAQDIAAGKFDQRIPVERADELGQLAISFNTMTERLQSSYARLEQQVEQRTAELRRSLEELRIKDIAIASSINAIAIADMDGKLSYVNHAFADLWRLQSSEDAIGRSSVGFWEKPEEAQAVIDALQHQAQWRGELRALLHDGSLADMELSASTVMDSAGKPLCMMGSFVDITQRKQTEQALAQSEALYRTLAQLAPVGIFRTDAAGATTFVNEPYCEISGQSREAALGQGWVTAVHPDDRARVLQEWQQAVKQQQSFASELRLQRPDGRVIWVETHARAEPDADGKVTGFVGALTDISERKHAEEVLRNANGELEQRVELRTALLRAAKDEAEQANLSKSLFLTSMSHELRTPLNAILGYAQLMQIDSTLPQNVIENAAEIQRAGDFLLNLMNDILDLSRIESGNLQLKPEVVAISEVLKDCHAHNIQTAISRNVTLHIGESCAAYHVVADKRGLTQVLNNLVSNAIKYNRAGGRVNVTCAPDAGGNIKVSVRDTGLGIAADKQLQLFQPFNRLGAELGNIEGTGIGLVISRRLVEGMGGVIGMESVYGVGSTFWLELPMAKNVNPDLLKASASGTTPAVSKQARRVLVAEDYAPNQNVLLLQLETMGFEVDIAADGAAALKMWRQNPYDLILTDIDMPIMNGTELAQAVRDEERSRGGRIPIVAITATNTSSELKRNQLAGIDEVLSKPLSMVALRAGLTHWFGEITAMPSRAPVYKSEDQADEGADDAVLNLNYLYHILGQVNLDQARMLVDTFIHTADEGLQALGAQMDNAVVVAKEMHKQKSSASTVGALRYANLAATLERQTRDENFTAVAPALAELRQALDEVVVAAAANLLESSRKRTAEPATAAYLPSVSYRSALVVDDDMVVLQQVRAMLQALGVSEVLTAINGVEANSVLAARDGEIEVLVCDLSMPQMDGVELIRRVGKTGFKGGLILISGADEKIISTVNKLAVLQGVRMLGQLQKPVSAGQLAILLAHATDLPLQELQLAAAPAVTGAAIRAAMAGNEFSIWFQPKVDAISLRAVGMEALARWQLPGGQFVQPDNFITVAEREGLIGELSRMLVSIALSEGIKLYAAGFPLKIAINLSGTWLNDLTLPDFILSRTRAVGMQAEDVILEVTETGVMEDLATALDVLSRLRLKGFGLSIDDFGIGYSSFEQLGRIPFTEMKLDKSFVCKGVQDVAARAILESSMDMAHKLKLSTVAEGVETELDLKLVRSLGCDLLQGYLIAKPMLVQDLIVWLENNAKTGRRRW